MPKRLASYSETLIDNIFSIVLSCDAKSGKINATISGRLLRFLFASNVLANTLSNPIN